MVVTSRSHDTALTDSTDRRTASDLGYLVFRVLVAGLFLNHGIYHFGHLTAFKGFMKFVHIPAPELMAYVTASFEVAAGVCLILGLLTRAWAGLGVLMMLVTAFYVKVSELHQGLLAPTGASQAETDLLFLAGFLVLLAVGAGAYSLDVIFGTDSRLRRLTTT
jgi:putative oxidoreductase